MAAVVLLAASCVRQGPEGTPGGTRVAAPAAAPKTVWDRQIRNATDAGDGDYDLRVLRERVEGDPSNIPARLELAKAYSQRGYPEVALEIYRLAVARFPESSEARLGLVRALHDVNRRGEAIEVVEAYLASHPQAPAEYHSWLGILRDESGEWAQGEPHHRQALALDPGSGGALWALHNNLGYNLLMQKKYEEAAAEFREALRLNPGSQVARNNLGLALANLNAAEAVANWKTVSDEATAHNNLAAVWIEKKDYAQARKELEIALSYNKSNPAALHNLELVSRLDGKPAAIDAKPAESRWERLKTGFIRLWVGPLEDSHADADKPQTSSSPGEKQ
jgi:tetratricopeptide (TPR) repeat protein